MGRGITVSEQYLLFNVPIQYNQYTCICTQILRRTPRENKYIHTRITARLWICTNPRVPHAIRLIGVHMQNLIAVCAIESSDVLRCHGCAHQEEHWIHPRRPCFLEFLVCLLAIEYMMLAALQDKLARSCKFGDFGTLMHGRIEITEWQDFHKRVPSPGWVVDRGDGRGFYPNLREMWIRHLLRHCWSVFRVAIHMLSATHHPSRDKTPMLRIRHVVHLQNSWIALRAAAITLRLC